VSKSPQATSPWAYFLLVFVLSTPFYVIALTGWRLPVADFLPASALMTFAPLCAALIFVARKESFAAAKALLARIADYRRVARTQWIFAALAIMPLVALLQ